MNSQKQNFMLGTEVLTTVGDLIRWACSALSAAPVYFGHGTDNAADEARVLVFHGLNLDYAVPDYFYGTHVTEHERHRVVELIKTRIERRVPAAYITGESWFAGLRFCVDERVLVPRSPFAELILHRFEPWLIDHEPRRILDLCTGSGCIAIACSYVFEQAIVDASDIDAGALEVARLNVEEHQLGARVNVIESDLFTSLGNQQYDLIVSNPPYVPQSSMDALPAEYHHEPVIGLVAEDQGLDLVRKIVRQAADYLSDDGLLVVEVGEIADAVAAEFNGLELMWCDFEQGGEGVFAVTGHALKRAFK